MRFDEINLNENALLTVNGLTGGDKQVVQFSENGLIWRTASAPIDPESSIKNIGNRTYIVESVYNDPVASSEKLRTAVIQACDFANTFGSSIDNRVTVLVMPGRYSIAGDPIEINASYVDIIGISSNPKSVTLINEYDIGSLLRYTDCEDSKLENLTLDASGFYCLNFSIMGIDTYLRWKNVISSGYGFKSFNPFGNTTGFACANLRGEFRDILCYPSQNIVHTFAIAQISINAIFENITCYNSIEVFGNYGAGSIIGTFSNIRVIESYLCFFNQELVGGLGIFATIKNLEVKNQNQSIAFFIRGEDLNLNCDGVSILFLVSPQFFFYSESYLRGVYNNIDISSSSPPNIFRATDKIESEFHNIDIILLNTANNTQLFSVKTGDTIRGTFSNVKIKNDTTMGSIISCFDDSLVSTIDSDLDLNIENFEIIGPGAVNYFCSNTFGGTVSGTFRNIKTSNITEVAFNAQNVIGNFSDINFYQSSVLFLASKLISGSYKNIKINETRDNAYYFYCMQGQLTGDFENITINNPQNFTSYIFSSDSYTPNSVIRAKMKNINIGYTHRLMQSNNIDCIIDNFVFGQVGLVDSCFQAESSLTGTYSNIRTNSDQFSFFTTLYGLINANVKNVYLANISRSCFSATNYQLLGNYENIVIGNLTDYLGNGCFYGYNGIFGNFKNIKIGDGYASVTNHFTTNDGDMVGTFEDIVIGTNSYNSFASLNGGKIGGTFKDILVPQNYLNKSFSFASMTQSTVFDNVKNYNLFGSTFSGKMFNCVMVNKNEFGNGGQTLKEGFYIERNTPIDTPHEIVIENTDFYYFGNERVMVPAFMGQIEIDLYGDIIIDGYYNSNFVNLPGSLYNIHIINCGFYYGLAPATSSGPLGGEIDTGCGIVSVAPLQKGNNVGAYSFGFEGIIPRPI